MNKKHHLISGSLLVVFMLFLTGCAQQQIAEKGFLEGKISIGPICPVERNPPDPNCLPNAETFKAWPIAVYTSDKKTIVEIIQPNSDGTFKLSLPAGEYIIDLEKKNTIGIGGNNLPSNITINANLTTNFDVEIDTGIR